jgi:predicted Fe-Mo cluster-binding NifX family protein
MKIAITSTGKDLDSQVDPRFGRCAYFLIVNIDDMSFEAIDNASMSLGGGAGIQAGQFVASRGAKALLTGSVGPNASRTLNAAGLDVIVGVSGSIRDAVERYKSGELKATTQANVPDHFGMGSTGGMGSGMGSGMGGGMGRGMGRGMGMGMGRGMGMGMPAYNPEPSSTSKNQDVESLRQEADALREQLNSILARIDEMGKN